MHNILKVIIAKTCIFILGLFGYYLVICPWGIGDTLFVCICSEELKRKKKKKLAVICKKYTGQVCKDFEFIDMIIANNRLCNCFIYYGEELGNKTSKNYVYAHILAENMKEYDTVVDRYRLGILNLNSNFEFVYPKIEKKKLYIDMTNAVIIAPYARSKSCVPSEAFWTRLAIFCKDRGMNVYTNCGKEGENEISGTIKLSVSLNELFLCAERAKLFISYRSGICDWIALSNSNMMVINDPIWGKEWDLNHFSKNKIKYFQYHPDTENDLISILENEIDSLCNGY